MKVPSPAIVLTLVVCACSAGAPRESPPLPPARGEVLAEGLLLKRAEIMAGPPATDLGPLRIWVVEKAEGVTSLLIELTGVLPMHIHTDGVHRMYVIEGAIRITVGTQTKELGPGDYIMIPRGVRHRVERLGGSKAVYASVDTPPIDPKQIVWIEPAPHP